MPSPPTWKQPGGAWPSCTSTGPACPRPWSATGPDLVIYCKAWRVRNASGRFAKDQFTLDFAAGQLTCPARVSMPFEPGKTVRLLCPGRRRRRAMAERDCAPPGALRDFAYLFLDAGMGCAIVSDGEVRRGSGGLAGEVAHLVTTGPQGQAMHLIDVFGELGLRQAGSTAIDADRLLAAVSGNQPQAEAIRYTLGQAISGVLAAVVSLSDPQLIIIGGSWGAHPLILDVITAASTRMPGMPPSGQPS
jgi:hypothetical protein